MYLLKKQIPTLVLMIGIIVSFASTVQCAGISQDQKNQLKELAAQTRQKTRSERQNLMHARAELFEAYHNYNLNEHKARVAIEKIDQSQLKLLYIHLDNQIGIRNILDASRFAQFRSMIDTKMRGCRAGAMTPMREDSLDKLVNKTILEDMNLSADQTSQLSRLAKQKENIVKKLRRDSKQMADMYADYDLDPSAAKKLINSIHRQQSSLLNVNFKKQQTIREILTEDQFNNLTDRISRRMRKF